MPKFTLEPIVAEQYAALREKRQIEMHPDIWRRVDLFAQPLGSTGYALGQVLDQILPALPAQGKKRGSTDTPEQAKQERKAAA